MTAPVQGSTPQHRLIAGRYRLDDVLGRGAMGVVWQAEDTLLRRPVAVKEVILPLGLSPSERSVACERTLREARAIARLAHPNVVTLFDVTDEDGRPWVVMELVRARSLAQVVREDGPISPAHVASIGLAVLSALEAAHAAGITHRDVKPGNILIADDGRVKLTDFGIARSADDAALTSTGLLLGSPSYIAPEVVRGQSAGPGSDLFGLGSTLYAAVEGRPPFRGDDPISTLNAVASEPPEPYKKAGALAPVLDGLLRKNPAERMAAPAARQMLLKVSRQDDKTVAQVSPPTLVVGRPAPPGMPPAPRGPVPPPAPFPAPFPQYGPYQPAPAPFPARGSFQPAPALFQPTAPPRPAPFAMSYADPRGPDPRGLGLSFGGAGGPPDDRNRRTAGALAVVGGLVVALLIGGVVLIKGVSGGSAPAPRPTRTSGGSSGNSGPAGIPTGYQQFTDPGGLYTVGVPDGWRPLPQRVGVIDVHNPTNDAEFLRLMAQRSGATALAALESEEPGFATRYPSYVKVSMATAAYRGYDAADWEFTFVRNGVQRHVLYRAFVLGGRLFGIYLSAPEDAFGDARRHFDTATTTFVVTS